MIKFKITNALLYLLVFLFSALITTTVNAELSCSISQIAADEEEFRGISGSSDSNIIAVGHGDPASFYHYDGTTWTKHADTSNEKLHDVSVVNSSLAYAVGHDGKVMQFNGTNWTNFSPSPSTSEDLNGVVATSSSDLWIVGKDNTLFQWDGSSWTNMSGGSQADVDDDKDLQDAWGNASTFYTVEKDGDLYRYTKSSSTWDKFTACNTAFNMEAKALWSDGAGKVYIAGENKDIDEASIFLYEESTNSCSIIVSSNTEDKLEGIYGNGNTIYAVGKDGLILSYVSGSWTETTQGDEDFKAVWVSPTSMPYYAGKKGYISSCIEAGQPTPIAEYRFDECSLASQVDDTQGNFHGIATGTDSSEVESVLGGRSLDLSKTEKTDWVTLPKILLNNIDDFTFSVWFKTANSNRQQEIFQALGSGTSDDELEVYIKDNNAISFKVRDDSTSLRANQTLTNNVWHHIIITRQGRNACLYVDGVQEDCDSSSVGSGVLSVANDNSIIIGQEQDRLRNSPDSNSGFNAGQSFQGFIDELKIYPTLLSPAQISTIYTNESSGNNTDGTSRTPLTCHTVIPDPVASYHLDELTWDGSINEVRDDSGNGLHGVAKSGANTKQLSPAIIGNPGTCGYGVFDGQNDYVEIADSPQFDIRDELTVSTWIYPLFIPRRGLKSIVSKDTNYEFHINSSGQIFWWWGGGSRSLTTTGAIIPINTWTHISIVYSDRNNSQAIYINGVLRASKSISGALSLNNKPFQIGADQNFSGRFFPGRIDETMVYNQALTQSEVQQVMTATHPCDVITEASNFNCVATNSDAITGRLYTQISNHPFTIDVTALQNTTTLATNFSNTVSVELVDASSGDCSTHQVLNPEINQSLNFVSGSGIEASAEMTSSNAYQNLKCRVTDTTSGSTIVGCSTDAFAIRPEGFTIASPVNNNNHTGSPTKIAGTEFNIIANTNISNYDGTPIIDDSQITAHAGAIQTGVLAGSFPAADPATGNSTGSNFTYSEVGNIQLNVNAVIDSSYTAVDAGGGDCTNNSSNIANADGKIGCNIANDSAIDIGRFIPDHFEISIVNQGSFGGSAYACTNFNYIGQDFSYDTKPEVKVTAYNGLTPKAITQNYTNNYAKLSIGDFNFTAPTTDANELGADSLSLVSLNWSAIAPDLTDNHNGSLTLTFGNDNFNYLQQTNSLVAPFTNSVEFEFTDITDSDSVSSSNLPLSATPSGASMRFGRLSIHSSHGAETAPLTVPVITEYFNGANWTVNNMDSCTSLNINSNILLSNPASGNNLSGNSLMIIENGSSSSSFLNAPFSAGIGNLIFTAPGEDNQGYIDIKGSLTGFEWLQFDWNSDGSFTNNPSGRASFGLFKGSEKLIFRREVY